MKALFRALLAIVGVLALVVVAGVIYVTTFLDPNDLKPRLVKAVKDQAGLELALNGPLDWSFYPRLGVSVEDAEAWLPEQERDQSPFASFTRAEVGVSFTPLLSGEVEVEGVFLDGLKLALERDAQGRGNWESLLEHAATAADSGAADEALPPAKSAGVALADDTTPSVQNGAGSMAVNLDIASVQVTNGQIAYQDAASGLEMTLNDVALTSSNVSPDKAFPVELSFVADGREPELQSTVSLDGKVALDLQGGRHVLTGVSLDTTTRMPSLGDKDQSVALDIDTLTLDTDKQLYLADGAELDATLHQAALGDKALPLKATFGAEADLAAGTANLENLLLTSGSDLRLSGALKAKDITGDALSYSGQFKLAPLSPKAWMTRVGMEAPQTAKSSALTSLAFSSPFKGDMSQVQLTNLVMALDDTTINGRLGSSFDASQITFDLDVDALNLDDYLAPAGADEKTASLGEALTAGVIAPVYAADGDAELLPVALLKTLGLQGQLDIGTLIASGLEMSKVTAKLSGQPGVQQLDSLTASLYGGSLAANARIDSRKTPLSMSFGEKLTNLDIAPFLKALAPEQKDILRGRLTLNGDYTTSTNQIDSIKRNLNGKGNFEIRNGEVLDVNISKEMCTAVATLSGKTSSREWKANTPLERAQGSFTVTNGVISNQDLALAIPGIALDGKGQLNLPTEAFDYNVAARFIEGADDAACEVNPRLIKLRFPVQCQGNLSGEPGEWCGFDQKGFQSAAAELAKDEAKRKAGEKVSEKLDEKLDEDTRKKIDDKLGEGASDKLKGAIQGLFN
ncbi:AsmA family protein [Cobetia sp.]|jgi:AsmA protein|uniref:AsmA family protein n=2 Tax=Cobetia sp. TaxID=1873876 RepID=UPI000C46B8A7|nr:AsmA family protein [Cobetia sp.]MBF10493.1 AsmA family protein [Cobetia sp.]HAR08340.1 AsmA family protein [Cobetia sp.]HBJ27253.1 AsmA family protein [Cobetia sp.]|tara:strand:- start:1884 stop:4277 length:2394 start_codon:yes stop_codon:yes gene_type:complete